MNEQIQQFADKIWAEEYWDNPNTDKLLPAQLNKFAELIVKEMCGMMEQVEDDAYHCFEPGERPTEYIEWLNQWRTRFEKHFGVEE
jgi:hypothetical protein